MGSFEGSFEASSLRFNPEPCGFGGFGFRVSDLGFRVQGLGFRV